MENRVLLNSVVNIVYPTALTTNTFGGRYGDREGEKEGMR